MQVLPPTIKQHVHMPARGFALRAVHLLYT